VIWSLILMLFALSLTWAATTDRYAPHPKVTRAVMDASRSGSRTIVVAALCVAFWAGRIW